MPKAVRGKTSKLGHTASRGDTPNLVFLGLRKPGASIKIKRAVVSTTGKAAKLGDLQRPWNRSGCRMSDTKRSDEGEEEKTQDEEEEARCDG